MTTDQEMVDLENSSFSSIKVYNCSVRSAFFSIHFTIIHSFKIKFSYVDHHFTTPSPNLVLLSETKLYNDVSTGSLLTLSNIFIKIPRS